VTGTTKEMTNTVEALLVEWLTRLATFCRQFRVLNDYVFLHKGEVEPIQFILLHEFELQFILLNESVYTPS
jgi:hypothetical protein